MKTIAITNNKGGVGKTTSAQNIGASLAQRGHKTLFIDLDPQGSLTRSYGIAFDQIKNTSSDFILGNCLADECILFAGEVGLIPCQPVAKTGEQVLSATPMYHNKLKKALTQVNGFDFCVIDCAPSLGAFTVNALVASDFYFVPMQAEFLSYEGLASLLAFTQPIEDESDTQLGGVFGTRYHPRMRKAIAHQIVTLAGDQLGNVFMKEAFIRECIALSEAQAMGKDIFDYSPQSNAAIDYTKLTDEIFNRIG